MKKNLMMAIGLLMMGLLAGCTGGTGTQSSVPDSKPVAHEHIWDEGEVTKAPNCTTAGEKTLHCTDPNCNKTKKEKIEPLGHLVAANAAFEHDADSHWKKCTREGCDSDGKADFAPHNFKDGTKTGLLMKEACDCGVDAYRLDIAEADGWNNPESKMNGKEAPNNKSTWNVSGLPAGKYAVQLSVKLTYDSHSDRYWYNMHETDTASSPDKDTEDPFRYFITLDDGKAINPTNEKTWGDDGLNASDFKYVTIIASMDVANGVSTLSLNHGNIGYSMIINHVRLISIS